jgi:hypothetical protein
MFGFIQRVRLSENTPHYHDEAIPHRHFLRLYVAENARWFDLPGRPGWSNYFSLVSPTMLSIGSNSLKCGDIIPNGPNLFDIGTADTIRNFLETHLHRRFDYRVKWHGRCSYCKYLCQFWWQPSPRNGRTDSRRRRRHKKYVDDTDAAIMAYVNTRDADTRTNVNAKDTAIRTYVDTKDAATRTFAEGVDTRLDDFCTTFKFTLAQPLSLPVLSVMTVQVAAGMIFFTNTTTTIYDYFEINEFRDPRIEVMIVAPDRSIEIKRFYL